MRLFLGRSLSLILILLTVSSPKAQENGEIPTTVQVQTQDQKEEGEDCAPETAEDPTGMAMYWGNLKKLVKRNPNRPKPVKKSEVKKWKAMGHRYAGGYDDSGNLLMVADLSFPTLLSPGQIGRTMVGTLGIGHLNVKSLIDLGLDPYIHHRDKKKKKAISKFMEEETPEVKEGINEDEGTTPEKFTMADINLEKLSGKSLDKFNHLMAKVGYKKNFLEGIQFEKNKDGGYDVYFAARNADHDLYKVIDFRAYKSSYKKAGMILAAMTILKAAIGSIPAQATYGAKNVLSALVERWLWLFETQRLNHHAQVLQLLDDAYHGDKDSPFSSLSKEELEKGLRYVHNTNTMWSNILAKLVLGRKNPWERKEELFEKKIGRSKEWLEKNQIEVTPVHRYFAYSKDRKGEPKKMFVLPHSMMFQKRPITAIDYKHPMKEIAKRTAKELVMQGMNYLDLAIPVPVVPTVIQILDNAFINDEVVRRKNWEGRLAAWMLNQQDIHGDKKWEKELNLLYSRRMNPFELSREEEEKLIRAKQIQLGIH